ncbi:MAG: Transcriptional regulatory protein DesR [Anaerolineales bacterium]|nr:Transcriptional regulatory protein DesR [Anaerolineales bacterium]
MIQSLRVTILDDHQSVIDGYLYRLGSAPQVDVVATILFGEELESTLKSHPTDVLLLDVNVPSSPDNPNPYPILHAIPALLQQHPNLAILVVSMYAERGLIRSVMEVGASGYILKDDQVAIRDLGNIVRSVAGGGIYFSQKAHQLYAEYLIRNDSEELTPRQREALSMCAAYPDWTMSQLAQKMAISNSTVRNLLSGAYVKLKVHNRSAAIAKARQLGLISPEPPTRSN